MRNWILVMTDKDKMHKRLQKKSARKIIAIVTVLFSGLFLTLKIIYNGKGIEISIPGEWRVILSTIIFFYFKRDWSDMDLSPNVD